MSIIGRTTVKRAEARLADRAPDCPPRLWSSGPSVRLSSVILVMWAFCVSTWAQSSREYQIKAVLVFNLTRFVEWPASAFATNDSPLIIGVLGRNPFGNALQEAAQGEHLNSHPIVVQHCDSIQEATNCHIVFVSSSERTRVAQILSTLRSRPVLTVSDWDGFASAGGIVSIYINVENKPRLRINANVAKAANLSLSPKLLQIAEITGGSK